MLIVHVTSGSGALRLAWSEAGTGYLLLQGQPLVEWHQDPVPTCAQLLAVGHGRQAVEPAIVDRLRQASADPARVVAERDLGAMAPLLQMLEPGLYGIAATTYYPTDGEGHFFWGRAAPNPTPVLASTEDLWAADIGMYALRPAFLYPSQPWGALDWARVDHYRTLARGGASLGGLTYHVQGGLSALLDGHQRATAACLEGQTLTCLSIVPLRSWARGNRESGVAGVSLGDQRQILRERLPGSVSRWLDAHFGKPSARIPAQQTQALRTRFRDGPDVQPPLPSELETAAGRYPTLRSLAVLAELGGVPAAADVEHGLEQSDVAGDRMGLMFEALIADGDAARAHALACRLARDERWRRLWRRAYPYLAAHPSPATDDVFVQFCVDDDGSQREIKAIVDAYFRQQA